MREKVRYLVVGGLNAGLTCAIYMLALFVLGINYVIALSIAFFCGVVFTYTLNYVWVFRPDEEFRFQSRFAKYLSSNLSIFLLNLILLYLIVEYLHEDPFLTQLGLMLMVVVANFCLAKYWSLRSHR